MKALTEEAPKCMVLLDGRMLLEWQELSLQQAGVTDIHIVGGYKHEKLPSRFPKCVNTIWDQTNMVSSLLKADELLKTHSCIVSYSDIVYTSDHIIKLQEAQGDICITYDSDWLDLWSLRFENPLDDAESFRAKNGLLQSIGSKTSSLAEIQGQYMGLLKFSPKGWEMLQEVVSSLSIVQVRRLDMTSLLSLMLSRNIPITAVRVEGKWCEVDSDEDLDLYHSLLKKEWRHNWQSTLEDPIS